MNIDALTSAGPIIFIHAVAALGALALGTVQMLMPKGGERHRAMGYVWAVLMMTVALSSLFIHQTRMWGPFSPIHILSIVTIIGVPSAILAARRGNFKRHRSGMMQLYWLALITAGAFTLMPGRIMHRVIFGS